MIPTLGFGTSELRGETAIRIVQHALNVGYRHIDTAPVYDNEREVGQALRSSGIPREEIFVTTKVWIDSFHTAALQKSVEMSLRRIDLNILDLVLLHWPNPKVPLEETIKSLNLVKRRGLVKHIGLSNFTIDLMIQVMACSEEPLVANQVEYHPFLNQQRLLEGVRAHGMKLVAHTPLARGTVFHDSVLQSIAKSHGKSAGQVALRWLDQQPGVVAIPSSKNPGHVCENWNVFDFTLSNEEMERIYALSRPNGRILNWEGFAPKWD
jgi:2,5-diketo-D-gluconate reductase B